MDKVLIKIISGSYGYQDGGVIERKTPVSEPFEVPEKEAQRLIGLKVAREATLSELNPDKDTDNGGDGMIYDADMTFAELREFAEAQQIEGYEKIKSKAKMLEFLDAFFAASDEFYEDDGEFSTDSGDEDDEFSTDGDGPADEDDNENPPTPTANNPV